MCTVSYGKAAKRHYQDAQILENANCKANSAQLYGISAECGLKWLLVRCGVLVNAQGNINRPLRVHINEFHNLSTQITATVSGSQNSHYFSRLSLLADFNDWSIAHRYCEGNSIPLSSFPKWKTASTEVNSMLDQALLDGVQL